MGVTLSIENAPDQVVDLLRKRAERNHRSVEGELLAIVEAAMQEERHMTPLEILAEIKKLGLSGPSGESAAIIRADRDSRY
jgi:plasmid stability protein